MVDSTNLLEVDINAIATDLNNKMDRDRVNATASVCIESWHDNNGNWYRVYSDGWCEQGGYVVVGSSKLATVTFEKPFINAKYTPMVTAAWKNNASGQNEGALNLYSTSMDVTTSYANVPIFWIAKGYIR